MKRIGGIYFSQNVPIFFHYITDRPSNGIVYLKTEFVISYMYNQSIFPNFTPPPYTTTDSNKFFLNIFKFNNFQMSIIRNKNRNIKMSTDRSQVDIL